MNDIKKEKSKHADSVIKNHVMLSMGAGVIPFPIVDVFAVGAMQLDMIKQLCRVYDQDFSETQGKAIVSALTTATMARIGAKSLVKLVPVIGSFIGGVTNAMMAGASTYALGQVFKAHFETGGTILDFEVERLKKLYNEQFEKGKKMADDLRQQQDAKREAAKAAEPATPATEPAEDLPKSPDDTIARLQQLGELRAAGIITEAEFERMKKRVMA